MNLETLEEDQNAIADVIAMIDVDKSGLSEKELQKVYEAQNPFWLALAAILKLKNENN